jgi:hypothetical protein
MIRVDVACGDSVWMWVLGMYAAWRTVCCRKKGAGLGIEIAETRETARERESERAME